MFSAPLRAGSAWALVGMETSAALPLVHGLTSTGTPAPLLGPAVTAAMLPVGFAAAHRFPRLAQSRARLIAGLVMALGARLALTFPFGVEPGALAVASIGWLFGAIVPGLVGLIAWWRGGFLASGELSAGDVRNEFAVVGGGLVLALTLFGQLLGADPSVEALAVASFLGFGFAAVALARQDAAGTPTGRGLATLAVLPPLAVGLALVTGLKPAVVAAIGSGVTAVLGVVLTVLMWLLTPLFWLLSLLPPLQPVLPDRPPRPTLPDLSNLPRSETPEWLTWLLLGTIGLLTLVVLAVIVWALVSLTQNRKDRWRRPRNGPVSVETAGGLDEDAGELVARLSGWLRRLMRRRPSAGTPEFDGRLAYRRLLRWAHDGGVDRRAPETPRRFQDRLDVDLPAGVAAYGPLTDAYEATRYGERLLEREHLEELRRLVEALESASPGSRPGPTPAS